MRSWFLLLLLAAVSAVRLRLGSAEGEPLPPSLVKLVRNSPISSVDDLKLLLQQISAIEEEEEDEHDIVPNRTHGRYPRSLMNIPVAQPAACKIRTEVMEVTRSMVDRRNADFWVFPLCVEVQRCSGCCNARQMQCVPTNTSSRYLQVNKIHFINRKLQYDKAIISVEDHVSCRCQAPLSPSSAAIPRSSVHVNPNPPPAPSLHHLRPLLPAPPKTHAYKADLHRHDDLKHNQQHRHPEDRDPAARQWQQGTYTHLVHWVQPRVHQVPGRVGTLGTSSSWPSEARAEHSVMGGPQHVPREGAQGSGSTEEGSVHVSKSGAKTHHADHAQRQHHHHHHQLHQQVNHGQSAGDQELRTQYRLHTPQSDSPLPHSTPTQTPADKPELKPRPLAPANQKDSADGMNGQNQTVFTNHKQIQTEGGGHKGPNEREESGSANSGDTPGPEAASQGQEKDSKVSGEGSLMEEERREKLLEMVQKEADPQSLLHPHHPQQRPKPTTFKTVLSTAVPGSPLAHQTPFRPASPRRRRKHRKRISKATIRAMIM
ncbi:uncharacterized protein si:ch211-79m20.1 [Thalassophryne amazonica]|uniref:uncharacterized protein si:ch211-79m20.1 n=1 Tax=Thalassophryne amazonica TaxID=390379 RepID=UPI0014710F3B|nr:uncharacterized protein si:ch211-79m20.1 [Thalassophryne amazonica]